MSGGLAGPHLRVPGPRPSCQFDRYLPRILPIRIVPMDRRSSSARSLCFSLNVSESHDSRTFDRYVEAFSARPSTAIQSFASVRTVSFTGTYGPERDRLAIPFAL